MSLKLAEQLVKRDKHDIPKELSEGDFADLLYTKGVPDLISLFGLRAKTAVQLPFMARGVFRIGVHRCIVAGFWAY